MGGQKNYTVNITGTVDSSLQQALAQINAEMQKIQSAANIRITGGGSPGAGVTSIRGGGAGGAVGVVAQSVVPSFGPVGHSTQAGGRPPAALRNIVASSYWDYAGSVGDDPSMLSYGQFRNRAYRAYRQGQQSISVGGGGTWDLPGSQRMPGSGDWWDAQDVSLSSPLPSANWSPGQRRFAQRQADLLKQIQQETVEIANKREIDARREFYANQPIGPSTHLGSTPEERAHTSAKARVDQEWTRLEEEGKTRSADFKLRAGAVKTVAGARVAMNDILSQAADSVSVLNNINRGLEADYGTAAEDQFAAGRAGYQSWDAGRKYRQRLGYGMLSVTGIGLSEWATAVQQQRMTGVDNPLAIAGAAGSFIGGTIGTAIGSMTSMGPFGALVGAGAGAQVGQHITSAMVALPMWRYNTMVQMAPYAAGTGADITNLPGQLRGFVDSEHRSRMLSSAQRFTGAVGMGNLWEEGKEFWGRYFGLYTGKDNLSPAQAGTIYEQMSAGAIAMGGGRDPLEMMKDLYRRMGSSGPLAASVAPQVGQAMAGLASVRGNPLDLAMAVGPQAASTFFGLYTDIDTKSLVSGVARIHEGQYTAQQATLGTGMAHTGLSRQMLMGLRPSQAGGAYGDVYGAMGEELTAMGGLLGSIAGTPGGKNSLLYKQTMAQYKQLQLDQTQLKLEETQGLLGEVGSVAGLRGAKIGLSGLSAMHSGSMEQIVQTAQKSVSAIDEEIQGYRDILHKRPMPWALRTQYETTILQRQAQKLQTSYGLGDTLLQLTRTSGTTSLSESQVGVSRAVMYGTDEEVAGAYGGLIGGIDTYSSSLQERMNDSRTSWMQKQSIRQEMAGLATQRMQVQSTAREISLHRRQTRFGLTEASAMAQMSRDYAISGAGAVRASSQTAITELEAEKSWIQEEMARGDLTFDQRSQLSRRSIDIGAQVFGIRNQAVDVAYGKEDLEGFGMAEMRMSHLERRMQMMPFSPGSTIAIAAGGIRLRNARIAQLRQRQYDLREAGLLSPERNFAIESSIEEGITQNYQSIQTIAEGMENRLPQLSGGGVNGFYRYNSTNLAAMNLAMMGHPGRLWGAVSGGQQNMQNRFTGSLGLGDLPALSRTQWLNNANQFDPRALDMLERIARNTEKLVQQALGVLYPQGRQSGSGMRGGGGGYQFGEGGSN